MAYLQLRFFGPPSVELNGAAVEFERRKTVALLAYLAVTGRSHTRETLASLFWPKAGQGPAYANLRRALWHINQVLGNGWILAKDRTLSLNLEADVRMDVIQFRRLVTEAGRAGGNCPQLIPRLAEAAELYADHFLAGFDLPDAPDFDEWLFFESEGLRRDLASVLETLAQCLSEAGQPEAAIAHARRWLALDPLNEAAHYRLMLIYEAAGEHSAAIRQYQECRRILDEELGVAPQPEMTALYEKLRTEGGQRQKALPFPTVIRKLTNLPAALTSFIGRDKEIAELKLLLDPGGREGDPASRARLITLTGPGGTGKTRLSLQTASQLLDMFVAGVWLVELASLNDPSLVPQSVAQTLGLREEANRSILDTLIDYLQTRDVLLILDNCEHLVAACATLAERLLSRCPHLTILTSSREALAVPGEIVYQVPPLTIPPPELANLTDDLQSLLQYESVRLFVERAATALPGFTLAADNAPAVVQICRRLDGIPLAIELAVARTPLLHVEQIAARLEDRFRLLTGGSRTALPRHQTLRALIDWSYDLLSEPEQALLRRLSVFAGGWSLVAAEAVCGVKAEGRSQKAEGNGEGVDLESWQVLELLAQLVNKSLVVTERKQGEETRYRLLETIREYAQEKLQQASEATMMSHRHLNYFLRLAEEAEPELSGPNQSLCLQRLDRELDNFRAALNWSIASTPATGSKLTLSEEKWRPIQAGLQLASALMRYWEVHNPLDEGTDWLTQLLHHPAARAPTETRARALAALALLRINRGEAAVARSLAAESLALYRALDNQPGIAFALYYLGCSACFQDDYETGRSALLESLALYRDLGDTFGVAEVLGSLGTLVQDLEHVQAQAYLEESLALCRELGHSAGIANRLAGLGLRALWHEEYPSARAWLEEALALYESFVVYDLSTPEVEDCLRALGVLSFRQGDYEQARAYFEECIARGRETGHIVPGLWSLANLGYVALRQGNETEAHELFAEAQQGFQRMGSQIGVIYTVEGQASLVVVQGHFRLAARLFAWADAARQAIRNARPPSEQADVDRDFATIRAHLTEAQITAAYKEGQTLTEAQVIGSALAPV